MPQAATVESLSAAFRMMKAMEAEWVERDADYRTAAGGCVPVIAFWTMDARYLHLERCYVKLHEALAAGEPVELFDLDYRSYSAGAGSACRIAWSWSVSTFYGSLLVVMVALLAYLAT